MPAISRLTLQSTMLHELPRGRQKDDDDSQIVYSKRPTALDVRTDRFIREEMLEPFLPSAREIVESENSSSPVPGLLRAALEDNSKLPETSRSLADWMHKKQGGGSSAGVFMSSLASSDGTSRFVILKAEHQEGVRLNHTGTGDDIEFQVQHLTELIMGQNSQVYKIAVVWLQSEAGKLSGLMVDKQNGVGFADFFLFDFLGFELTHRAEVLTEGFVKGINKFINSATVPEEKRLRYASAVVAVLESPAPRLVPRRFLTDFIDAEDRDVAAEFLGVQVANGEFQKDTTLVRAQIGGLKVHTTTDVLITASSDALGDGTVVIDSQNPEGPRIIVKGSPNDYKLARRPK